MIIEIPPYRHFNGHLDDICNSCCPFWALNECGAELGYYVKSWEALLPKECCPGPGKYKLVKLEEE